ncbi:MAG: histidine--tRNA ligase [Thermotogae bacterium]|nr:histidine--tRNA ligase [Thermotogota bacterium]
MVKYIIVNTIYKGVTDLSAYKKIKGTQDIFGKEIDYWKYFEEKANDFMGRYAFNEIRTPIMEQTELFHRGIGEGTDVVQKEMYTFDDKGGRSVTLRPEGTASAVRAYIENSLMNMGSPIKLYYNGPMFRYEKPQSGRLRQFHQFGCEIFGTADVLADAELISIAHNLFSEIGLRKYTIKINSIGKKEERENYIKALKDYYGNYLSEMCDDCKVRYENNTMRLLDCKIDTQYAKNAPSILDFLGEESKKDFENLKKYLDILGVPYVVDPGIIRGLDYYNNTAFEIEHELLGAQGVIAGGGRYDGLVSEIGANPTPAVGFAIGIERVILSMKAEGIEVSDESPVDVYVIFSGEEAKKEALEISNELRKRGINVFMNISSRNFSAQMKHSNKINSKFTAIIGEDEVKEKIITFKEMSNGEQTKVEKNWFLEIIEEKLKKQ